VKRPAFALAAVLGALALCGSAAPSEPRSHLLVCYSRDGLSSAASIEQRFGAERVASIPQLDVHVLQVEQDRLEATLTAFRLEPGVRYAQADGLVRAFRVPNDEFWPTQWSPRTTRADLAWDVTTGSSQVVVAVVDTGVDPDQPDLRGKLVPGFDFVSDDAEPHDDNGHGTDVAGIVAASSNNGIGVAGYCWGCLVMPVKVLGADGTGTASALAQGLVWAADHGARVINVSLGGPVEDLTVASAARYARLHGALVVAAAGNDSASLLEYPAALPDVLSVSASDPGDRLYGFSNSGAALAAPGENSTTAAGGGYEQFLGTSSAAPVVSGIAGLVLSAAPDIDVAEVERALEWTASPLPGVTYGRVDALGAVGTVAPPPSTTPPGEPPASGSGQARRTRVFTGRLNGSRRARGFLIATGAGVVRAAVSLSPRTGRGAELRLLGAGGRAVAAAAGTRSAAVRARVKGGSYRVIVRSRGPDPLRFRLVVTFPAPR
jgi:subtilisin family serine protease